MPGVNDQGLGLRRPLTIRKWHFPLNSIAVHLAVSAHQNSIIRAGACYPLPLSLRLHFLGSRVVFSFSDSVGDGIPTSKKEKGFFCSQSASEPTPVCSRWHRGKALECSSFVALDKSLYLPEPQLPPLYNNKGIPDDLPSQHLVLKSQRGLSYHSSLRIQKYFLTGMCTVSKINSEEAGIQSHE